MKDRPQIPTLPPEVIGQVYSYLRLSISRLVWFVEEYHQTPARAVINWWGLSQSQSLRPICTTPDRKQTAVGDPRTYTVTYPIRCHADIFSRYLEDMQAIVIDVSDAQLGDVLGRAIVQGIQTISYNRPLIGLHAVYDDTGRAIAELTLSLQLYPAARAPIRSVAPAKEAKPARGHDPGWGRLVDEVTEPSYCEPREHGSPVAAADNLPEARSRDPLEELLAPSTYRLASEPRSQSLEPLEPLVLGVSVSWPHGSARESIAVQAPGLRFSPLKKQDGLFVASVWLTTPFLASCRNNVLTVALSNGGNGTATAQVALRFIYDAYMRGAFGSSSPLVTSENDTIAFSSSEPLFAAQVRCVAALGTANELLRWSASHSAGVPAPRAEAAVQTDTKQPTERGQDTGAGRSGGAAENGTVFTQGAESRAQGSDGNATVDVTVAIDGLSKLVKASEDGHHVRPKVTWGQAMGEERSLEDGGDRQWQFAAGLTIHPETALSEQVRVTFSKGDGEHVGTALVDPAPLTLGMAKIEGWYPVLDMSQHIVGEIFVRVEAKDPQELWRRSFAVFASGNAAGDGAIPPRDVPTPAKPASSQSVDQAPAEPPGDLGIPDHAVPPSVALLRATLASSSDSFALEQLAASLSEMERLSQAAMQVANNMLETPAPS